MSSTPKETLNDICKKLNDYVKIVDHIVEQDLVTISSKESLKEFSIFIKERIDQLSKPVFKIATFGTTSAGKSTLLNTLLGYKVAPIDRAELSAGVLRFQYQADLISYAQNHEKFENISIEDLYLKLKNTMSNYHENANKKSSIVPSSFTVKLPMKPIVDNLLGHLLADLNLELIDLPGINSSIDEKNFPIVRQFINDTLNLIVLNYTDTDDEKISQIYKEIKLILDLISNKEGKIIFVLNKIDQRTNSDYPLEDFINKLKLKIKNELNLVQSPDIIPYSALSLLNFQVFYEQFKKGKNQNEIINSFKNFIDDDHFIKKNIKADWEKNRDAKVNSLRIFIRDYDDLIDDQERIKYFVDHSNIIDEMMNYIINVSGANQLWNTIKAKLEKDFNTIIILPKIIAIQEKHIILLEKLDLELKTHNIKNINALKKEHQRLAEIKKEIEDTLPECTILFKNEIEELLKDFKQFITNTSNMRLANEYKDKYEDFTPFMGLIDDIKKDIRFRILEVIHEGLSNRTRAHILFNDLNIVHKDMIDLLRNAYENFATKIHVVLNYQNENTSISYKKRNVSLDEKRFNQNQLNEIDEARLKLYVCVRKTCSFFAKRQIQLKLKELSTVFRNYINELLDDIRDEIQEIFDNQEGDLKWSLNDHISIEDIALPSDLFQVKSPTSKSQLKNQKVEVGTKVETQSCAKDIVTKIYETQEFFSFEIKSLDKMLEEWESGIETATTELADLINHSVKLMSEKSLNDIENTITNNWQFIDMLVHQQKLNIEENLMISEANQRLLELNISNFKNIFMEIQKQTNIVKPSNQNKKNKKHRQNKNKRR